MDKFINHFKEQGFIAEERIGLDQVTKHIDRAFKDLKAAEANLDIDSTVSYNCAYLAMLRAGRALMFLFGCRPIDGQQHKTVVLFAKEVLGNEFIDKKLGNFCIIGTKIVTKVLKDGDWVEVDANKGL